MNFIKKLPGRLLGALCIFGCSSGNDEQERKDLLRWINYHLAQISNHVEADIEKEKQGFYPHDAKTAYSSKGCIDYVLKEKTGERLLVSEHALLTLSDIENSTAYQQLAGRIAALKLYISISEKLVEGDEVESYDEIDEYISDRERYFIITVSGW